MAALVVPTIFTAVDRLSGVISRMQNSVGGFAGKTSIAVNSLNKGLNSLLPSMGGMAKQFLNLAGTAAVFGGVAFSFKSLIDAEKALASFRKQVSELDDKAFAPYKAQIQTVAETTRRSFIDVAGSFEMIALRNHDLAKTADGMALISRAGIILSKASDMEIKPATEALVDVLSQFSLGADQASRVINILSAETKYGSATIQEQVDAYKLFLPVAKSANMTLEQSSALVGTLAKHQLRGEIAGTILKTGIIRLQKAGLGYKSGVFEINDALEQSLSIYNRLATARQKDQFLIKLFGTRGILGGRILLNNVDQFKQITRDITGTSEATRQAAIYTNTLSNRLVELKNTWINWLTGNQGAGEGLQRLKGIIVYITDHLDTLVNIVIRAAEVFLGLKAAIWATQIAIGAYDIAVGIMGAVTGVASLRIGESAVAMGAYRTVVGLATLSNYLFGTSFAAATVGANGLKTAVAGAEGSFAMAGEAATGFSGILAGILGPLGLLLIAYKNINDIIEHVHDNVGYGWDNIPPPKMTTAGILAANAKAYKKVFGAQHPVINPTPGFTPFHELAGEKAKRDSLNAIVLPALNRPSITSDTSLKNDPHIIHITVDDKGHIIKEVHHNGKPVIPVHTTSTTGNR